jgi:hypothetical protein
LFNAENPNDFLAAPISITDKMQQLTSLRTLPVVFFSLINVWMDLDAIARLYATFDKRIQTLLSISRTLRTAEIAPLDVAQHWHIPYYLMAICDFKSLALLKHANITGDGLKVLSRLNPTSITLDTHSICTLLQKNIPFSYSSQRYRLLGPHASTSDTTLVSFPSRLDIGKYFSNLQTLVIHCPVASVLSTPKGTPPAMSEEYALLFHFVSCLPVGLQTLHCPTFGISDHIELDELFSLFPKSLTDVRLGIKCTYLNSLSRIVRPLPNLRILRLTMNSRNSLEYQRFPDDKSIPYSLTDLQISIRSKSLVNNNITRIFPWRDSSIQVLSLIGESLTPKFKEGSFDLNQDLPRNLLELRLTESLIRYASRKISITTFPTTLTALYLGTNYLDTDLLKLLQPLSSLQLFSMLPSTRPPETPDWCYLPRTLTNLELRQYSISGGEILQLPSTLTRLHCHIELLEDVQTLLAQCPNCFFFCDGDIFLTPLNMAHVLHAGLAYLERVSSYSILDQIYKILGSRCSINFGFSRSSSRLTQTEWLTLAPNNKSLVLESHVAFLRHLSLSSLTFEMSLVKSLQTLTLLEFQSKTEISSLKFCPPNLTSLNLRKSPIKTVINLRDMPKSLTSFICHFDSSLLITADYLPPTHQLLILDTPYLVFSGDDIKKGLNEKLEVIRAKISWMFDKDIEPLIKSWKTAKTIDMSFVVKATGHLLSETTNYMSFENLKRDTISYLIAIPGINGIDVIPPSLLFVPPTVTSVNLLWNDNVPSSLVGFENDVLPTSVTHLEVHLCRDAKKLWSKLPESLLYLHVDTLNLAYEYCGPINSQKLHTLILQCRPQPKNFPMTDMWLTSMPQSLRHLRMIHCQPHFSKAKATDPQMPNLYLIEMQATGLSNQYKMEQVAPNAAFEWLL